MVVNKFCKTSINFFNSAPHEAKAVMNLKCIFFDLRNANFRPSCSYTLLKIRNTLNFLTLKLNEFLRRT